MNFNIGRAYPKYDFIITGISYVGEPQDNTVMYVSKKVAYLVDKLFGHKNCLLFAETGVSVDEDILKKNAVIFTSNPEYEYAKFIIAIANEEVEAEKKKKYSFVDGYYIGEDVTIGDNAYIEPGCMIGHGVKIGKNATILGGAIIKNAIIGDSFYCNENAVIGANAFDMAEDDNGNKLRIPAFGKVVIKNNVEVGACDNVSRGKSGNTVIEDNVKIDALIHIPHDAHLHKNVEITAGCTIGGYTEIGEDTHLGIGSVIRNRLKIGKGCMIGMGSIVVKNVEDNTVVVGNPARPLIKE